MISKQILILISPLEFIQGAFFVQIKFVVIRIINFKLF